MKIYYYNRRINGQFDSFKMKLKRAIHFLKNLAIVGASGTAIFFLGAYTFSTSSVEAQFVRTTEIQALDMPILNKIADCESGNGSKGSATQFKSGQVLVKGNKNGSVDVGLYQINTVWFKKATELGYDVMTTKGNKEMAEWIYLNRGTGDWSASSKCWQN